MEKVKVTQVCIKDKPDVCRGERPSYTNHWVIEDSIIFREMLSASEVLERFGDVLTEKEKEGLTLFYGTKGHEYTTK
jgi:hypothetical protein